MYSFIDDYMETSHYSLLGVSIAPGFDYNDLRTAPYGCLVDLWNLNRRNLPFLFEIKTFFYNNQKFVSIAHKQ